MTRRGRGKARSIAAAVAGIGGAIAGAAMLLRDEPAPPEPDQPPQEPETRADAPLPEPAFAPAPQAEVLEIAQHDREISEAPEPPVAMPLTDRPAAVPTGESRSMPLADASTPEPPPQAPPDQIALAPEAMLPPPLAAAGSPPEQGISAAEAPVPPAIPPQAGVLPAIAPEPGVAPPAGTGPAPAPPVEPTLASADPPPRAVASRTGARRSIPRRAAAAATPGLAAAPARPQPSPGVQPSPGPAPSAGLVLPKPAFGSDAAVRPAGAASPPAALGPESAMPSFGTRPTFTYDDELILQIESRQGGVSETITAYGTRAGVYLPLGEIARLLDVALAVSDEGQYASGWILEESNTVALNLRAGTLRTGSKEVPLDPRDAVAMDGELYLRAERFADLMPLALKVDLRSQTVALTTLRPFPFEQRAQREASRERLGSRSASAGPAPYPREATPWLALDVPLADVELRTASDTTHGARGEADVRLAGDIAFMTGQVFASGSTDHGLTAARIELGRRDPDAGLLGPLRATEFQMGDVTTASLPLGLRGIGGRGGMIANTPLETASVFDRIDLRGELPDGYEAELYRNNTLIGSTSRAIDGRYEFLQVPVEFGLNVFRLVLYGPQGQRREDVRRISVGDGRLGTGELRYSFGFAQKDVNLLGVHGPDFSPGQDHGAWRATGQLQYGVSAALTATMGGAWYESGGRRKWLATTGLRTGIGGMAAQFDFGVNDAGGKAAEARMGGSVAGLNWTATHAEYFGRFSDELRAFTIEPLRRASEADFNATLRIGPADGERTIPLAARARRIEFADGRAQVDATLRASALVSRLLVSNSLTFARSSVPGGGGSTRLTGSFDLASLSGSRTQYRASLGYSAVPHARLTTASVEVDRGLGPDTRVKASVGRAFEGDTTTLGLSAIHRLGPLSIAFDGNVNLPDHNYSAVLRLGFSLGRNPITRAPFLAQPGMAAGGMVAVRAFEDSNQNHRFDPGEPVLPDVEFGTGTLTARTAADGVALIGQLGDASRAHLRLNTETLPDIALAPQRPGVEIIPRPGRIHASEFAVDPLGEIEGTARFGESLQAVTGLVLLLIDDQGKPAARVRTTSGGLFLFEQLHPGEYRLTLEPGQAGRLGLRLASEPVVRIDGTARLARLEVRVVKAR